MLNKIMKQLMALFVCISMVVTMFPTTIIEVKAADSDAPVITITDDSYNKVISQKNYAIAPGVSESQITFNDSTGTNQNKGYVMEIDFSNQYVNAMASYKNQDPTVWGTQIMSDQAASAEDKFGVNVVGAINCNLRFGSEEPIGMLVIDGTVYHEEITEHGYLVIKKDGTAEIREGNVPLDGTEQQAVTANMGWLVRDGKNQWGEDHSQGDRHPRTAIGIKEDGNIVLFVVDGRQVPTSVGMTMYELAQTMINFGCVTAINCDGGGTSTFLTEREGTGSLELRNTPSDGGERATLGGLLILSEAKSTGEFDHAALTPNEEYYTPNTTVKLEGVGTDFSGAASDSIPSTVTWELAEGYEGMGTIENTLISNNKTVTDFVSNGTEGKVIVNLVNENEVVGTTTFYIYHPDTIMFSSDSINLDYQEVSNLGLLAYVNNQPLNLKAEDVTWEIGDSSAGQFNGLNFVGTDNVLASVSTEIKVTYKANTSLTDSITLNIGMQPSIVMDGGDTDGLTYDEFGRVIARVSSPYGIGYWEKGSSTTVDLITAHYTNNERNCSNSSEWRGGNESAEYITVEDEKWTDIIRFGNGAVKLNYDFSNANGIEGACLGFANNIYLTGSPTAIGMWVYAPEGTTNLWLRGAIGVETSEGSGEYLYTFINFTERADTAWNNSNGKDVGGINWTGWKYVEADISSFKGRTICVMAGETVRVMYTNGKYGPAVNGVSTGMGNLTIDGTYVPKEECKGWILVDNLQFVYGTNNQDVTNPNVNDVVVVNKDSSTTKIENNLTIKNNDVQFRYYYDDNELNDKFATGVVTKLFYFDGVNYGSGDDYASEGFTQLNATLSDGEHNLTCYVKDDFGNVTTKTVNFVIDGDTSYPTIEVDSDDTIYVGDTYEINISSDYLTSSSYSIEDIKELYAELTINEIFSVKEIKFAEGFDGTYTYENGKIVLSAKPNGSEVTSDTIVKINIYAPTTLSEGSNFDWKITKGLLTLVDGTMSQNEWSFSTSINYVPVGSRYIIDSEVLIIGKEGVIKVFNENNEPVKNVSVLVDEQSIGVTNNEGILTTDYFSTEAKTWSIIAQDENGAVSFPKKVTSYATEGETTPYYILSNAVKDPKTQKNISWMVNPSNADFKAIMRISRNEDMSNYTEFEGTCTSSDYKITGVATYNNNVTATGLKAGTKYYYQVGDGTTFSEVRSFTTAKNTTTTSFFVIGDMQGTDADIAGTYSDIMISSGIDYAFGMQTGDAVDNPEKYDEWQTLLEIFSKGIYADTDLVHVIGNHEVFGGDNLASAAISMFGIPTNDPEGWYSFEYGNVYVAVISYTLNPEKAEESLKWLAEDAAKSKCEWKVVGLHVPVYKSNSEQFDSDIYVNRLPEVAESVGIDFVFSGHDHSYGRTNPLVDGVKNEDGVVYYIVGTAGDKKYVCSDNGYDFEIVTQNYDAIYLSVTATEKYIEVTTYNVKDGVATVFDTYRKDVPLCPNDDHNYIYDKATDMLTCSECKADSINASSRFYSGFATDKDTGKLRYFVGGRIQTGYVYLSGKNYFFDEEGLGYEGEYILCGEKCLFDDGQFVSCTTADVIFAGMAGPNVEFVIYENGHMVLDGSGYMQTFSHYTYVPWQSYRTSIKSLYVGAEILNLSDSSFFECVNLQKVEFEQGSELQRVDGSVFYHNTSLKEIVLPNTVTTLYGNAFAKCFNLTSIYLPDGVSYMSSSAFKECSKVVLSVAPNSYAKDYAVTNKISYIERVPVVILTGSCGANATFELYNDGTLNINGTGAMTNFASYSSVPWYSYRSTVKQINIAAGITEIGDLAFAYCTDLEEVNFANNSELTIIGGSAFRECTSLTKLELPEKVTTIYGNAIARCTSLKSVYLPDAVNYMSSSAFNGSTKVTLSVGADSYAKNYAVKNNITYVERKVQLIASGSCGTSAKYELYSDGTLNINGTGAMTNFTSYANVPWDSYRSMIKQVNIAAGITEIGDLAFAYCTVLKEVNFANNSELTIIGGSTFKGCSSLTELELPEKVTTIYGNAIAKCTSLKSVYLPDAVNYMSSSAFNGSTKVTLSVGADSYAKGYAVKNSIAYVERKVQLIASGACGTSATYELFSDGTLNIYGTGAMTNFTSNASVPWYSYRSMIKQVNIAAGITEIGDLAFAYCTSLESVTFGNNSKLKVVGGSAFKGCSSLTELKLPENVTIIYGNAISNCTSLTSVYLPNSVNYMSSSAFAGSTKVTLSVASGSYSEEYAKKNTVVYIVR